MGLSINFHIGSGNIPMFGTDNPGQHLGYAWTSSMLFMLNASRSRHSCSAASASGSPT